MSAQELNKSPELWLSVCVPVPVGPTEGQRKQQVTQILAFPLKLGHLLFLLPLSANVVH